jgi:hypothetical protein
MTGEVPLAALVNLTANLNLGAAGIFSQLLTVVVMRPGSLAMLVMAIFYVWVYVRRVFYPSSCTETGARKQENSAPAIA